MTQRLQLVASETSDSDGNATFTFSSVPQGLVWTGTLAVPNAPTTATMTAYVGFPGSTPLASFAGISTCGPIMAASRETVFVTAQGLSAETPYVCTFTGGSDSEAADIQWQGPNGQAPSSALTTGIGAFRVLDLFDQVVAQLFVAPDSSYTVIPGLSVRFLDNGLPTDPSTQISMTSGVAGGTGQSELLLAGSNASNPGGATFTLKSDAGDFTTSSGIRGATHDTLSPSSPTTVEIFAGEVTNIGLRVQWDGTHIDTVVAENDTQARVGFFGSSGTAQQAVTGSRSAALATVVNNLLNILAGHNLIVNSTTP